MDTEVTVTDGVLREVLVPAISVLVRVIELPVGDAAGLSLGDWVSAGEGDSAGESVGLGLGEAVSVVSCALAKAKRTTRKNKTNLLKIFITVSGQW